MSDSSFFFWLGTTGEDWNTPANWADVTTGQTPAIIVPGSLDIVVINDGTLSGSGGSASLTFTDTNAVLGDLNTGTLIVGENGLASGTLDIAMGATVSAIAATEIGMISVSGSASALLINGLLEVGEPSTSGVLSATNGAFIQTGGLVLDGGSGDQIIVNEFATIEIGAAGGAASGALTVDPGQRLSGSGSVIGNLIDNGAISGGSLTLGQPLVYAGGVGPSSFGGSTFTSSLSGTGTVEVEASGMITLQEPIVTPGLTFQLDGTATLDIQASISGGNTINLSGGSNTIAINDQWYLVKHPAEQVGQSPYYTGGPPKVDATINGLGDSDVLSFEDDPFLGITVTAASYAGGLLTLFNGSVDVEAFKLNGNYDNKSFSVGDSTNSQQLITVACFVAGTRIRTASGETVVEDLHEGDLVIVLRKDRLSEEKVKWIGQRCINLACHPHPDLARPVRFRCDAIAPMQPHRDLLVSPDHCLFIEGRLVPAYSLLNDRTIVQERGQGSVHYFHIELDQHGVLLAEGLPAESYLDTGNRATFANAGLAMLLHPEFQVNESLRSWHRDAYAPLPPNADWLEALWKRLADRGEEMGFQPTQISTDSEPNLHAVVVGQVIDPICRSADQYVFVLPAGTRQVILSSRATRPADIVGYLDRRLLGVAIRNITLRIGLDVSEFPADHLPSGSGWYDYEDSGVGPWRWTNGAGELLFDPLPQVALLEVRLSGTTRYIVEEIPARTAG